MQISILSVRTATAGQASGPAVYELGLPSSYICLISSIENAPEDREFVDPTVQATNRIDVVISGIIPVPNVGGANPEWNRNREGSLGDR